MSEVGTSRAKQSVKSPAGTAKAVREQAKRSTTTVALTPGEAARERVKRYLVQRFYTRFHMSLILMSSGFAAMLSNWVLLQAGLKAMWVRYPIAITLAYFTFLAGVWLWLQYIRITQGETNRQSFIDGGDLPTVNLVPGGGGSLNVDGVMGGGGSFDGGGASGEWVEANPVQALASNGPSASPDGGGVFSDVGKSFGDFVDLDGEAIVLIVLALLLIFSVLLLSGYVIWFAPDILGEAIFGATLAGSLAGAAKRQDADGWVMGVVKKTWWPFAIVFVVAMVFSIYAAAHYPGASTFGTVLSMAVS